MSLFFQHSPFLLVLCALLAAAGAYWGYRRTVPVLATGPRVVLATLRFLSFFLICFLLFEPIFQRTTTEERRPVLAVLIDDSQSVLNSVQPDSVPQDGDIRAVLRALELPANADVRAYRFSASTVPLGANRADWLDSLSATGQRTDIAAALRHVQEDLRDEWMGGVLLVSDGRYNTGSNPLYVAEQYPVPIHTLVVGDTTRQRDVALGRIAANRVAYVDVEQPVEVDVRAHGFQGSRLSVALHEGGRVLGQATVQVAGETAHIPVRLTYTPTTPGLRTLAISVSEVEGEQTHRNNHTTLSVRVMEQKRQVLLLGGAPEPDVGAVRQILSENPNVELTVRVHKTADTFYEGALAVDALDDFDVLILVGFPSTGTPRALADAVAQTIEDGTPAVALLSQSTSLAMLAASFSDALPVTPSGERRGWMEALAVPTAEGQQHPVLAGTQQGGAQWRQLPPLHVSDSRWLISPDSRVLATIEVRGVQLDDPLIVLRSRSGNRTAAVLGAGTWRWKNLPPDLQAADRLWPETLSNLIQWTTAAQDQRPVRVRPVQDVFAGGEAVEFVGEVYDESMQPVVGASLEIEVTSDDGRDHVLRFSDVGNGRYVLETTGLAEGTYTYRATARRGETPLGTDTGSFAVGELALEHRDTQADPALMRQLAARSGGQALKPGEAGALGRRIEANTPLQSISASIVAETNLRRKPVFLLLIVLLLTTEWVLRKRSGLA